jgi:hypothetical protein
MRSTTIWTSEMSADPAFGRNFLNGFSGLFAFVTMNLVVGFEVISATTNSTLLGAVGVGTSEEPAAVALFKIDLLFPGLRENPCRKHNNVCVSKSVDDLTVGIWNRKGEVGFGIGI